MSLARCLGSATLLWLLCVILVHFFFSDRLPPAILSINVPGWAPASWNAQTIASWMTIVPNKSTFTETFFALPLYIGWWVRDHQIWGLPLLFCGALILFGLWRLAAHVLGMRKPSVFFPALIVLQCAALGWGWTFYAPLPYYMRAGMSVVDLTIKYNSILSPEQQIRWYHKNGYDAFPAEETKTIFHQFFEGNTAYDESFLITPSLATSYAAQLSPNANWWVFPKEGYERPSETDLRKAWKKGKVAAVTLKNRPQTGWDLMPPASQMTIFLSVLLLLFFAISWGMQPPSAPLSAPGRVADFLHKNRRLKRWGGMLMMVSTFAGTLLALWLTFYPAWGFVRYETLPLRTTALLCVALDYCYWLGHKSWKRKH